MTFKRKTDSKDKGEEQAVPHPALILFKGGMFNKITNKNTFKMILISLQLETKDRVTKE